MDNIDFICCKIHICEGVRNLVIIILYMEKKKESRSLFDKKMNQVWISNLIWWKTSALNKIKWTYLNFYYATQQVSNPIYQQ